MNHRLQCRCGKLTGTVAEPASAIRAICYCNDCRAYAFHLGTPNAVLDANGGTSVVATQGRHVAIDKGAEHLACVSLSPKGLLRWYALCCTTPIANTPRDWRLPYVGLVHNGLAKPLEASFPAAQMPVNASKLRNRPSRPGLRGFLALTRFGGRMIFARLTGRYRTTPFFTADGQPVVNIDVLSREERDKATRAAQASFDPSS
ncbi:MAG TPA: DUF6151 family protein [Casimicrobiaceae bacterium]|nr:DUF6151 family protein [Casimicrobiaceae bacterium]